MKRGLNFDVKAMPLFYILVFVNKNPHFESTWIDSYFTAIPVLQFYFSHPYQLLVATKLLLLFRNCELYRRFFNSGFYSLPPAPASSC